MTSIKLDIYGFIKRCDSIVATEDVVVVRLNNIALYTILWSALKDISTS
jgi:hypothetical protein